MKRPFILYHWSPTKNRASIMRHGLIPGCTSRTNEFVAPYIAFSDSPSLAWSLSGCQCPNRCRWDLWMVWSSWAKKMRRRNDLANGRGSPTEYRVFHSIPRGGMWLIGTRIEK